MATAALAALPLEPGNRLLAEYWLSLWDGDALPWRRAFVPGRVRNLLPGIMIQEIKAGERVLVRLSGTAVNQAFGLDLTGRDVMELSPPVHREQRRARNASAADGAATLYRREAKTRFGARAVSQDLQLPFGDVTEDGARLVLLHTTWRPTDAMPGVAEVVELVEPPLEFRVIALWRE